MPLLDQGSFKPRVKRTMTCTKFSGHDIFESEMRSPLSGNAKALRLASPLEKFSWGDHVLEG